MRATQIDLRAQALELFRRDAAFRRDVAALLAPELFAQLAGLIGAPAKPQFYSTKSGRGPAGRSDRQFRADFNAALAEGAPGFVRRAGERWGRVDPVAYDVWAASKVTRASAPCPAAPAAELADIDDFTAAARTLGRPSNGPVRR